MPKFKIDKIYDMKIITPKVEIIKKNIPYQIKVSEKKYNDFINQNKDYIGESYNNTTMDMHVVKDLYNNIIAGVYFYGENEYYINPELLKLGLEHKKEIKDDIKIVGEDIQEINVKPSSIDFQFSNPCVPKVLNSDFWIK